MRNVLYVVVRHRRSETAYGNTWGQKGFLLKITTTEQVLEAAERAKLEGASVYVYEVACPKPLKSHISQEVRVEKVDRETMTVTFSGHRGMYHKGPFTVSQGMNCKWTDKTPTEKVKR